MANYLPSLEERLKNLIENCCGGSDGMSDGPGADGEPPTADMEANSLIDRTIDNLKAKRKKRKTHGT